MSSIVDDVYQVALAAQKKAYAPYSTFLVGAAWKVKGEDQIYSGFNVENASYGATVCAERTALYRAITDLQRKPEFEFVVIVTSTEPASPPCGLCLQVMSEFCSGDMPVFLANEKGIQKELTFADFLPQPFDLDS